MPHLCGTVCTFISILLIMYSTGHVTLPPPYQEECLTNQYKNASNGDVKTYILNLDISPRARWNQVSRDHRDNIRALVNEIKTFVGTSQLAKDIISIVDKMGILADRFPADYGEEIKGIADVTGLNLGEVVLYNIFYEVFSVCTSIVATNWQPNGQIHARNLDFGLLMGWDVQNNTWIMTEILRKLVVNVDHQVRGQTVFRAVHFAGYIGVLSAVKPRVFTLTMNERFDIDGGYIGILEWLVGANNASWMGFLTRQALQSAGSYEQAKRVLSNTPLIAPAYFILGSNVSGEGCVITRSREKALDVWQMNNGTVALPWILETNYDHWKTPLVIDDRRTPANDCMRKHYHTDGISPSTVYDVLSSKPVLNKLTTYTVLMNVTSGSMDTYLRYCPDPCWGW